MLARRRRSYVSRRKRAPQKVGKPFQAFSLSRRSVFSLKFFPFPFHSPSLAIFHVFCQVSIIRKRARKKIGGKNKRRTQILVLLIRSIPVLKLLFRVSILRGAKLLSTTFLRNWKKTRNSRKNEKVSTFPRRGRGFRERVQEYGHGWICN